MKREVVDCNKKGTKWAEFPSLEWTCKTHKTTHGKLHQSDACRIRELEQEVENLKVIVDAVGDWFKTRKVTALAILTKALDKEDGDDG